MARPTDLQNLHNVMGMQGCFAEIVDVKDPKKAGRVLCRITGLHENAEDRNLLQWVKVMNQGSRGHNAWGGCRFLPGDRCFLMGLNEQDLWTAEWLRCSNSETDENTADQHPDAIKVASADQKNVPYPNDKRKGPPSKLQGAQAKTYQDLVPLAKQLTTRGARKFSQLETTAQHSKGQERSKEALEQMAPNEFKNRIQSRLAEITNPIGLFNFDGTQSTVDFKQAKNSPFLSEKTPDIIKKLKQAAQSGSNITASSAVGGIGNITASLAAAASHVSNIQEQNEQNELDPLEYFLRQLYRLITGLEPLDANGNETLEYTLWKAAWYAARDLVQEATTS